MKHIFHIDDSILFNLAFYWNSRPKGRVNFYGSRYFVFVRNTSLPASIMISYETADDDRTSAVCNNLTASMIYRNNYDILFETSSERYIYLRFIFSCGLSSRKVNLIISNKGRLVRYVARTYSREILQFFFVRSEIESIFIENTHLMLQFLW